jgi:hypothetical protein
MLGEAGDRYDDLGLAINVFFRGLLLVDSNLNDAYPLTGAAAGAVDKANANRELRKTKLRWTTNTEMWCLIEHRTSMLRCGESRLPVKLAGFFRSV